MVNTIMIAIRLYLIYNNKYTNILLFTDSRKKYHIRVKLSRVQKMPVYVYNIIHRRGLNVRKQDAILRNF